jgi:hypothetical protein
MQDLACWCNGVPKQHIYEVVYEIYEPLQIYEQLCVTKEAFLSFNPPLRTRKSFGNLKFC